MGDPSSWLVVEPGWEVLGSDGAHVGKVHEVIGDTGKDIFNGLAVSHGLLKRSRYVPAELVGSIEEGRVLLTIGRNEFNALTEHAAVPPSVEVRADTTDLPRT